MTSRYDYLAALGLTDWTVREDGPLGLRGSVSAAPSVIDSDAVQAPTTDGAGARAEAEAAIKTPRQTADATQPVIDSPSVTDKASKIDETSPRASSQTDAPSTANRSASLLAGDEMPVESVSRYTPDLTTMDWAELEAYLNEQDRRGATHAVFGIGARDADILIVGEAPGANEDAQGVPFVGRAGQLLDRMLFAIGCSRDTNVYITNICKFRPPDNRDPTAEEVAMDWPILERQIDLMQPKLVVAVGRIAAQTLLDCKTPLGKLRGTLHRYPRRELDVLVTYHPAYLLRSPGQKAKAWVDLKTIARHIGAWRP